MSHGLESLVQSATNVHLFASVNGFLLVNQPDNPSEMFFIDDFSVICIIKWCGTKLFYNLLLQFLDEGIFYSAVAVNVIRCNTGLSAV